MKIIVNTYKQKTSQIQSEYTNLMQCVESQKERKKERKKKERKKCKHANDTR